MWVLPREWRRKISDCSEITCKITYGKVKKKKKKKRKKKSCPKEGEESETVEEWKTNVSSAAKKEYSEYLDDTPETDVRATCDE